MVIAGPPLSLLPELSGGQSFKGLASREPWMVPIISGSFVGLVCQIENFLRSLLIWYIYRWMKGRLDPGNTVSTGIMDCDYSGVVGICGMAVVVYI